MYEKNLRFVVRHWRAGLFDRRSAWRRMGIGRDLHRMWMRVAAGVAAVVAVGAVAAVIVINYRSVPTPATTAPETPQPVVPATPPTHAETVRAIDFEDTPLTEVADRIEDVYNVEIDNLPSDAASMRLTLHYEGDAGGLVETINELLDTDITIHRP